MEDKGYAYSETITFWRNKKVQWNWFGIRYGIRRSDKMQWFPVWNRSCNSYRELQFGFGLWYLAVVYSKRRSNYNKWYYKYLPFRNKFWKLYNLIA